VTVTTRPPPAAPRPPWWRVEPEPRGVAGALVVVPSLLLFVPLLLFQRSPCPGEAPPWDARVLGAGFAGAGLAVTLRHLATAPRAVFAAALLACAAPVAVGLAVGPPSDWGLGRVEDAFAVLGVAACAALGTLGLLRGSDPPVSVRVSTLGTVALAVLLLAIPEALERTFPPFARGVAFSLFLAWRVSVHVREETRLARATPPPRPRPRPRGTTSPAPPPP
jgi:hypothetical protein